MSDEQSSGQPPAGEARSDVSLRSGTDRSLLLGLLALQNNLISREQLVTAFSLWALDKSRSLADLLQQQQALQSDTRALLEALVRMHVERHAGDPQQSLRALSSLGDVRQELLSIGLPDLQASLNQIPPDVKGADPFATQVGIETSQGTRFRILRPHARGGLGEVFVALDTELQREVALKEIQDRHAGRHDVRARFKLEAEITGGLEHPGIVPVYGLGTYADGRPFYAMRFIKGDNLQQAISSYHDPRQQGHTGWKNLALRGLLRRLIDVCEAMQYAHDRGILHRDLKPGNIMIGKYGETLVVDWGLAKVMGFSSPKVLDNDDLSPEPLLKPATAESGSLNQTFAGSAVGTPAYMSPEQAAGRLDELGPASDVYSLGGTLFHILTGRPPCEGSDLGDVLRKVQRGEIKGPRQVQPTVPAPLDAICRHAMALQPGARYASPRELAIDLEHWLADEPVKAMPEGRVSRTARWMRRNRAVTLSFSIATPMVLASLLIANYVVNLAQQNAAQSLNRETKALALSTYVTAFETGLQLESWDQSHLRKLDDTLAELQKLSPTRATEGRQRLVTRYAALLQQQLRIARLTEHDLTVIKAGLVLLEARDAPTAQQLRTELELRINSWESVVELQDDLAGWQKVFDPQTIQFRDGGLFPIKSAAAATVPPTVPISQRVSTSVVTSADVQCAAEFAVTGVLTSPLGVEFFNSEKVGYSFLVLPVANATAPVLEQNPVTLTRQVRIAILRNGQTLREAIVTRDQLGKEPIHIRAQRRGSRLELQVNQLPALEMIDPFPLPTSRPGNTAVQLPENAAVVRFATERMRRSSVPSPLESADELFAQGDFQAALVKYRKQAQQSGADEYGDESRYKQAGCLLGLAQSKEAQQLWQQLSDEGRSRWSTLADFQLWSLYLEQHDKQGAEDIYQKLALKYKFEELAQIAPDDLRRRIVDFKTDVSGRTGTGIRLVYDSNRIRHLQRAAELQRLLNDKSPAAYSAADNLANEYRAFGDYDRALPIAKDYLTTSPDVDHALSYCRILRETGRASESLVIAERELATPTRDWGFYSYFIQLERLYCLLALQRTDEAEAFATAIVEQYRAPFDRAVQAGTPFTQANLVVPFVVAQFIRGFLLESKGNHEAALVAWRESTLTGIPNQRLAQFSLKAYYIVRSTTNDIDDADIDHFLLQSQGGGQGDLLKLAMSYVSRDSISRTVRNTWKSSRAKDLARRFAFDQLTVREKLSIWLVASASQFFIESLLDAGSHPEQEELIWETTKQSYHLLSVEGKLVVAQLLPLAVTWKGNPGFLGWDSVAQSLPVDLRAPLAYIFGLRYQKLGRPVDAQKFYRTAIKSAPPDSLTAKLATQELAKIEGP